MPSRASASNASKPAWTVSSPSRSSRWKCTRPWNHAPRKPWPRQSRDESSPSSSSDLRMHPRCAVRPAQEPIRFVVAKHAAFFRVPGKPAAELHGEIGEDATRRGNVALLDVGHGPAAGGDRREKILHVPPHCGRDVDFDVLLRHVLWVL